MDGYVSSGADRPLDPNASWVQRGRIAGWARRRGRRVARMFEERAQNGSLDARPVLDQALARVESRESDGVVVARLQDLGSSLGEALRAIERVQAAGGTFVSVCDGIDLGTATGRLILRLLLSVADW
jgi:DNA invertase Pin-like site-specific DNA recombinase